MRIRAADDSKGVTLPNGWALEAGDVLVVSDATWNTIEADDRLMTNVTLVESTSEAPTPVPSWRDIQRSAFAWEGSDPTGGGEVSGPDPEQVFSFASASTLWTCTHNFGKKYVDVITVDASGDDVEGEIEYVSTTQLKIHWYYPMSGTARVSP